LNFSQDFFVFADPLFEGLGFHWISQYTRAFNDHPLMNLC